MQPFFAHQTPPRSTPQLLNQTVTNDPSADLAPDPPTSFETVRTGEIGSVQVTSSFSGLQRLSAEA